MKYTGRIVKLKINLQTKEKELHEIISFLKCLYLCRSKFTCVESKDTLIALLCVITYIFFNVMLRIHLIIIPMKCNVQQQNI